MANISKRRFITQLPQVHQTGVLKNFFAATIDNLFQPGRSEPISGYVGQKPTYYDPSKDFYVAETDAVRAAYQLEPAMVSTNSANDITHSLAYIDMINYLRSQGANVDNHSRLFENDYYSWSPPVDLDKLNNPRQYVWMGELSDDEYRLTGLNLHAPRRVDGYVAGETQEFLLPPANPEYSGQFENPVVLVNGKVVRSIHGPTSVTILEPLNNGDVIETIRYGNIKAVLEGQKTVDLDYFLQWTNETHGYDGSSYRATMEKHYTVGDIVVVDDVTYRCVTDHVADQEFNPQYWAAIAPVKATSGLSVVLEDGSGTIARFYPAWASMTFYEANTIISHEGSYWIARADHTSDTVFETARWKFFGTVSKRYFMDGVGSSIVLSEDYSRDAGGRRPWHSIIDRRSQDRNPWSLRNLWVHKDALLWTGLDFQSRVATRPIIEFLPNLELFNYGTRRLFDIDATLSTEKALLRDSYDLFPYDLLPWQSEEIPVSRINGQPVGYLSFYEKNPDGSYTTNPPTKERLDPFGSVEVDPFTVSKQWHPNIVMEQGDRILMGMRFYVATETHVSRDFQDDLSEGKWEQRMGHLLKPNDRLLVRQAVTGEPELNNLIYRVVVNEDVVLDGTTADVLELVVEGVPERGDIARVMRGENPSVFSDFDEYWFDGESWVEAQRGANAPLFMLYDADQNRLNDTGVYPSSDFAGSRLFGFKVGEGKADLTVGVPLSMNQYSQPIFEVDPITRRVSYEGGEIGGYYYHRFVDNGVERFSNNWFLVGKSSSQEQVDGVYEIPLNLQANPANEEVSYISRDEWFAHFSEIMEQQEGFEGHPYTANNWRDTPKNLGNGSKILQHRSPLLKTMLVASDPHFDILSAIRYVEQEYVRYRNKFIQKMLEFNKFGTRTQDEPAELWVQSIMEALRLNKTADFPFVLSASAGGQFFIPPTPATMGISKPVRPAIQNGFLRCHDGAEVPIMGDFRDAIMLAFEQKIFDSIDLTFHNRTEPLFELCDYVEGHWFKNENGYSRHEFNAIMAPMFERWAQINKLDYRTNTTFEHADPFTWNYAGSVMENGEYVIAGNYAGIYMHMFDTPRPHSHPWEMFGFAYMPDWWTQEYGAAPWTSGNHRLWQDVADGRIRQGIRAGVWDRYARPDIMNVIPVDDEGNLLPPNTIGIVPNNPSIQMAMAGWKFGDGSPVEMLWRKSPSYSFALAQAAFLMKPARFVEQCWDTLNIVQDAAGQWIYLPTGNRPLNSMLTIHGELMTDGTRYYGAGIQQWVSDYLLSKGQSPTLFGNAIRGLDVRLAHKVGGFTATGNITVIADNFGKVPQEDITISMYNSPSIREEVYSGVLIETMDRGWRVIGYDSRNPNFKIIRGLAHGPKGVISLSKQVEKPAPPWAPNVYYASGARVLHNNYFYESVRPHTSSDEFESQYWQILGEMPPQTPRVVTYLLGSGEVETIPYGTILETQQDVADFLLGYQRYLAEHGWVFDATEDEENDEVKDFYGATREFLGWSQVAWQTGSFITLSPFASGARFVTDHGMALDVLNPINGSYGIVDRTGYPIDRRDVVINRIDGEAHIAVKQGNLYGARVHVGEVEHLLVFSNTTIFGNIIYSPLFNLRQPRLRLIGNRSMGWSGRLDAPGYVLVDGEIVSNFEKASDDLQTMFDIEKADNNLLRDHARHGVGYNSRSYFQNLVLSETEQFEFYQGMIQQKGAPSAFTKLVRSDYIEQNRDLRFFEEWAIKLDEYGALGGRSRTSFLLGNSALKTDPQMIQFRNTGDYTTNADWVELIDRGVNIDTKWIDRPENPMQTFPVIESFDRQPQELPMSGYVRLNEVSEIIWDNTEFTNLFNEQKLSVGSRVWVHNIEVPSVTGIGSWSFVTRTADEATNILEGWLNTNSTLPNLGGYTVVDYDGSTYFRSRPCEANLLTSRNIAFPNGNIQEMEIRVRKVTSERNGKKSLITVGFDTYDADDNYLGRVGMVEAKGSDGRTIDTSLWESGEWNTIRVSVNPALNVARMRDLFHINHNDSEENSKYAKHVEFADAVYELDFPSFKSVQSRDWQVFQVFNASKDNEINRIYRVITQMENPSLPYYITRIELEREHGMSSEFIGREIFIYGPTQTTTEMEGVNIITNVGDNWFDVVSTNEQGIVYDREGFIPPTVRMIRPLRFSSQEAMDAHGRLGGVADGDIVYLDGVGQDEPWRVYRRRSTRLGQRYWEPMRRQPYRVDARAVASALVYDLKTKITDERIYPEPLVVSHLNVVAPASGIILGRASKDIDLRTPYDPANYSDTGWAKNQVGKLWWDLSTVRFLETETDNVVFGQSNQTRYETEASYRAQNWGKIAPASHVDIYEWTRNTMSPTDYMVAMARAPEMERDKFDGIPYGIGRSVDNFVDTEFEGITTSVDTPYAERVEFNRETGREEVVYYYWMLNRKTIAHDVDRELSPSTIARLISNPLSQGAEWMAPIMPNAMIVGGVQRSLDDNFEYGETEIKRSGTVVQVEIDTDPNNDGVVHEEWMLLRPDDERSQPPHWLWERMRDSLVGFDDSLSVVPAPAKIIVAEPPLTNGPTFENSPYELGGYENEPYYPHTENNNDQ